MEWLYRWICKHCSRLDIRRPRNKYDDVHRAHLSYSKKRKRKAHVPVCSERRLLHLLEKQIQQINDLYQKCKSKIILSPDYQKRFFVIKKLLAQEKELFNGKKIMDRIVGIKCHYLRPIVRHKETKTVEFGA